MAKKMNNDIELFIRLPIKLFIEDKLNNNDCCYINYMIGELISVIDNNETLAHVEFYNKTKVYFDTPFELNPNKDHPVVLWRIQAWRKSLQKYQERKAKSEQDLKETFKRREEIAKVLEAIILKTSLSKELAEPIAIRIVMTNRGAASNFGIEL